MEFLGPIPSVWDDTRALDGKISESVAVARRTGNDWYVGAMSDWTARDLEIDFSFLPDGSFSMDAYQDGANADRQASDYKLVKLQVNKDRKSTRLNSSHQIISYAVFCLKKKKHTGETQTTDYVGDGA